MNEYGTANSIYQTCHVCYQTRFQYTCFYWACLAYEPNTLRVENIPDDATSVELFRDTGSGMVKLSDMEIKSSAPASEFVYTFEVLHHTNESSVGFKEISVNKIETTVPLTGSNVKILKVPTKNNFTMEGTTETYLINDDQAFANTYIWAGQDDTSSAGVKDYDIGTQLFSITTTTRVNSFTFSKMQEPYIPGWKIYENDVVVFEDTSYRPDPYNGTRTNDYSYTVEWESPVPSGPSASVDIGTPGTYRANIKKRLTVRIHIYSRKLCLSQLTRSLNSQQVHLSQRIQSLALISKKILTLTQRTECP